MKNYYLKVGMIRKTRQRNAYGCFPACVSALTGRSYEQVRNRMAECAEWNKAYGVNFELLKIFYSEGVLSQPIKPAKFSEVDGIFIMAYDGHCVVAEKRGDEVFVMHDPWMKKEERIEGKVFSANKLADQIVWQLDDKAL